MGKDKNPVALLYYACPICGKKDEEQSEIAIHRGLRDLSSMDHQVVGFGHPCKNCQVLLAQGIVLIIVDEEKTTDIKNPWRTGQLVVMKEEAIPRIVNNDELAQSILRHRSTFIDWRTAEAIGIEIFKNE